MTQLLIDSATLEQLVRMLEQCLDDAVQVQCDLEQGYSKSLALAQMVQVALLRAQAATAPQPAPKGEPVCHGCGIPAGDVHMSTCKSGKWPSRVSNGDTAAPAPQAQDWKKETEYVPPLVKWAQEQPAQGEPVAYITETEQGPMVWTPEMYGEACTYCDDGEFPVPLYTHPLRELTDEEVEAVAITTASIVWPETGYVGWTDDDKVFFPKFARAVLKKAKE